ncbi:unnamed protein product [Brachionus calyciflorus]|uniref:Transmembrane protein 33 n=1 Tax=Brachionus calyciflorus TaxID=104777 RepID=A0A814KXD7_9BILA|nr:unnamed protein product [Brachionus calyciflorus]
MVLVEDVTNTNESNSSSTSSNANQQNTQQNNGGLSAFITNDKISFGLFLTRVFSIVCTFAFLIPIFGYDQNTLYQKAIMANAATSALKLHQRISHEPFQFSREYLGKLMIEDSFHYLLYSFIFLNTSAVTVVLVPIVAFALLHISAYARNLLNIVGPNSFGFVLKGINYVTSRQRDLMRFVAINEILLAPTILFMILTGKCGLFVPFIYYRFICMRYQSRRNPYSREMFYELRRAIEYYTSQPNCPQIFKNLSHRLIGLVTKLAPPQL